MTTIGSKGNKSRAKIHSNNTYMHHIRSSKQQFMEDINILLSNTIGFRRENLKKTKEIVNLKSIFNHKFRLIYFIIFLFLISMLCMDYFIIFIISMDI